MFRRDSGPISSRSSVSSRSSTPKGTPRHETPRGTPKSIPKTIKVHTIDGATKTLALNQEITVKQVCERMAQKMDARWADAYALFEIWENGDQCKLSDEQRVVDVVLNRAKQQDKYRDLLSNPPRLELRQWLFFKECDRDMILLEYAEMRHRVLTGMLGEGHEKEAVGLGAFSLQHDFGDFREDLHVPGFLVRERQLSSFVPESVTENKPAEMIESLMFGMHSKLVGMSKEQSALEYLKQVATWELFGMTWFEAEWLNDQTVSVGCASPPQMPKSGYLAVNETGLHYLDCKKDIVTSWTFNQLCSWASSSKHFGIVIGDTAEQLRLVFCTSEGVDISSLVQGYIDAIVNRRDRKMKVSASGLLLDSPTEAETPESNATLTCRDRTISSMDLRDIDELVTDMEWDVWDDLKQRASFAPRKGRIAALIRGR